jgi:hypothetical protein
MVEKRGDHLDEEGDAVKALVDGEGDAACVIGCDQIAFAKEGTIESGSARPEPHTGPYDHSSSSKVSSNRELAAALYDSGAA